MKTILAILTILLVLLFSPATAAVAPASVAAATADGLHWPSLGDIEAGAWIVVDAGTGEAILECQADLAVYPASTTKIMTAVLALESGQMDQMVTVSANAVNLPYGSSKAGFLEGEQVSLHDVMYGLLLASGNDAANILAEALAGSIEAFAIQMNDKAAALGMSGSHFKNPSGLQDPEHVVTARDMARLAVYAMENPDFRKIVSTRCYSLPATNLHPFDGWAAFSNSNRLVLFGDFFYKSGLIASYDGIKTGTTNDAGNNLVAAATTVAGQKLVSVLLGVPLKTKTGNTWMYTRTLLEEAARRSGATPSETTAETTAETTDGTTTSGTTTMTSAATTDATTSGTTAATTATSGETTANGTPGPADDAILWRSASIILAFALMASLAICLLVIDGLRHKLADARTRRTPPQ